MMTMIKRACRQGRSAARRLLLLAGLAAALAGAPARAQDGQMVTVPDVTSLSLPAAAAQLNASGLRLGTPSLTLATGDAGFAPGTVSAQSVAAGTSAAFGTAVDVSVVGSPNAALIYDDNDLTLVNRAGGSLRIGGVVFRASAGPAAFRAARWGETLEAGQCGQIWSVGRSAPKDVEGCDRLQWLSSTDRARHFWTALNGVSEFNVVEDGVVRATCPAAAGSAPLRCELALAGGGAGADTAPFIYFAYTADRLAILNPTEDQWMPMGQTPVFNFNPGIAVQGAAINLGDPSLFSARDPNADLARLAPGQCLLLTDGTTAEPEPPAPCRVIGGLRTSPQVAFWAARFEIESSSDGQRRACPAAAADKLTICVLPR